MQLLHYYLLLCSMAWFVIFTPYMDQRAPFLIFCFYGYSTNKNKNTHILLLCRFQARMQQQTDGKHGVDC